MMVWHWQLHREGGYDNTEVRRRTATGTEALQLCQPPAAPLGPEIMSNGLS